MQTGLFLLLLVAYACLSWTVEARMAVSSSSALQQLRASPADAVKTATARSQDMNNHLDSRKRLEKHLHKQPLTVHENHVWQKTEHSQSEEPMDSLKERQLEVEPEDDAECEMHVDKLASVMMKKNIGAHKIKASEKQQLLANGWRAVDPEQPGAVKIVCGNEESHLGMTQQCLLWKDGKATLKKEEEITALIRSEYMNKDKAAGPGVQKVSCDYMRIFYIGPRPKPPPEEKKTPGSGGQTQLPYGIGGQLPPGFKVTGFKVIGGSQENPQAQEKEDKGSDVVTGTGPRGQKRKCV